MTTLRPESWLTAADWLQYDDVGDASLMTSLITLFDTRQKYTAVTPVNSLLLLPLLLLMMIR